MARIVIKLNEERGVSILELSFVLPIFLIVLVGLVDVGFTLRNIEALGDVAKDNARYAASKDIECRSLAAKTEQRTVSSLIDMGYSTDKWKPEISFIYPGEMPPSQNPLNLTMVRVAIRNQKPCTLCIERLLKLSEVRAQAVFALEPRVGGSRNNPQKIACAPDDIRMPLS